MLEGFPFDRDIRYVEFSLDELTAAQQIMIADRSILQGGTSEPVDPDESAKLDQFPEVFIDLERRWDLDIDIRSNELVVNVPQVTDEVAQAFVDYYANVFDIALRIEEGVIEPACSRTDCRFRARGGLKIVNARFCTSGFAAKKDGNLKPVLFTAAHCNDDPYNNGGTRIVGSDSSVYFEERQSGATDAQVAKIDADWSPSSNILVSNSGTLRSITGKKSYQSTSVGTFVGKSGASSGTTKGDITSKNVSPNYVINSFNFMRTEACVNAGDSGGPVYRNNDAYGIVSGRFGTCSGGDGIFGNIVTAEQDVDATIYLGP